MLKKACYYIGLCFALLILTAPFNAYGYFKTWNDNTEDSRIESGNNTFNYGATAGYISVGGDGTDTGRTFVRFLGIEDSIPDHAVVTQADIFLYSHNQFNGTARNVSAYRLLLDWAEGTANGSAQYGSLNWDDAKRNLVSWTTPGAQSASDRSTTAEDVVSISGTTAQFWSWDVTTAVTNWDNGTWDNFGLVFIGEAEDLQSWKIFRPSEFGTAAQRPYIEVTYEIPPSITGLSGSGTLNASQTDSGTVTIQYEVTDYDEDSVTITMEYDTTAIGVFFAGTDLSGDTGLVDTSATADKIIYWDVGTALGQSIDTMFTVRLIATDDSSSVDTVTSASFRIDTENPTGLSGFSATDSTSTTATVQWSGTATDNHFSHYEIWYGTVLANVQARNASAYEWDDSDDSNLASAATDSTDITSLEYNTKYYFKIWALDSAGNEMTVAEDSITTETSSNPLVTGWDPDTDPTAAQINTDDVEIHYEVNDLDDSSVTITLETRLEDEGSWTAWATMDSYVSGDSGEIAASSTTDRTLTWDLRAQHGTIDTTGYVRVIGVDGASNADTGTSAQVILDTEAPTTLTGLTVDDSTGISMDLSWTAAQETNFSHYEIWYGFNQSDVENRTGTAKEWDHDPDDGSLAVVSTNSTTINDLLTDTLYYFKIWAVDDFGNELGNPVSAISHRTDTSTTVTLTDVSDVVLVDNWPNFNTGGHITGGATAGYRTANTMIRRTLLRIEDVEDVPYGATIKAARLWAYCDVTYAAGTNTISAYRLLRDFVEGTATLQDQTNSATWNEYGNENNWATAGAANTTTDREASSQDDVVVSTVAWYSWDLTSAFANWHDSTWSNQGVVFVASDETTGNLSKEFSSAEADSTPYMEVEYVLESPAVTGLSGASNVAATQVGDPDSATVDYEVSDPNDATVTVTLEYKTASGGSWTAASDVNGDTGTVSAASATTDRQIRWDVRAELGTSIDDDYLVRVIADDGKLKDTTVSDTFSLDTKTPVGLASFAVVDSLSYSMDLSWTSVTDEGHFSHYEIWFGSNLTDVNNRNGTAVEWDGDDDTGLRTVGTTTTTITGLSSSTKYYFKIWAVDSMTNEATVDPDSATTLEDPIPTVTGWGQSALVDADQYDTSNVRVGFEVVDLDETSAICSLGYTAHSPESWIKTVTASGDTGDITTGAGIQDTIIWDALADAGTNVDEQYRVRVWCVDDSGFADTTESAAFDLDTKDPTGMTALTGGAIDATSKVLNWDIITDETHFSHYEIWYGTDSADVDGRTGTALEWDNDNDAALATISTTTTTLTSLTPASRHWFKIWAQDSLGNEMTVAGISDSTLATNDPVVTGPSDAPQVAASQTSVDSITIQYEVDDANTDPVTIHLDYKLASAGTWSDMHNASGDSGSVSVGNGKTVLWSALDELGAVEDDYDVRVIADDASAQDTTESASFEIDTRAPQSLANLTQTDITGNTITLSWTVATDANFSHYEIWYGTTDTDTLKDGAGTEWDNSDDGTLTTSSTNSTTVTGLSTGTLYYFKIYALDDNGRDGTADHNSFTTLSEVTPDWDLASLGDVNGGSVDLTNLYIGLGGSGDKLVKYSVSSGAQRWSLSTSAYGDCNMATVAFTGGNIYVAASAGTHLILQQDNGGTSKSNVWSSGSAINLSATLGNPYISPDDSTIMVMASGNLHRRYTSGTGGAVSGWPLAVSNANTSADIVVFADDAYVGTTTGNVVKIDVGNTTTNGSYNIGGSVDYPLLVQDNHVYASSNGSSLDKVQTSNMSSTAWTASLGANATSAPFMEDDDTYIFIATGTSIRRIQDSDGAVTLLATETGTINTAPIEHNGTVYYGENTGTYHAISSTDGSDRTNWPYTQSSGNLIMGPVVENGTNNYIIFGTVGGDLTAFDLE